MSILKIARMGHPVLLQKAKAVDDPTRPEIRQLVADMVETMIDANGAGLAAPQVHVPLRVVVFQAPPERVPAEVEAQDGAAEEAFDHTAPLTVLINPEIKTLNDAVTGPEGCLSFPEVFADIERPESIEVTAKDHKGNEIKFSCGGLLAKAVQHEVDHLKGILFIDRMQRKDKEKWRAVLEDMRSSTQKELAESASS